MKTMRKLSTSRCNIVSTRRTTHSVTLHFDVSRPVLHLMALDTMLHDDCTGMYSSQRQGSPNYCSLICSSSYALSGCLSLGHHYGGEYFTNGTKDWGNFFSDFQCFTSLLCSYLHASEKQPSPPHGLGTNDAVSQVQLAKSHSCASPGFLRSIPIASNVRALPGIRSAEPLPVLC